MSLHNTNSLGCEFAVLSIRAVNNENVTAGLGALVERSRPHATKVLGRLKVKLRVLEIPEPILPNKLTDPANIAQRTFYQDAVARLTNMLGADPSESIAA
jgi:hypothetical protein